MRIRHPMQLRDSNLSYVFRVIHEEGPVSRTQLSERIGLSASTVWTMTGELQERGLIRECGRDGAHVGRPSILLEINPDGGYFLSADLTAETISVGVMDLSLKPLMTQTYGEDMDSGEALYTQLIQALKELHLSCVNKGMNVLGIGVATPGLVSQSGRVMEADNLGWEGMELEEHLRRDLDVDVVIVENDTNAAASGEFQYGTIRSLNVRNMLYVSIDKGIGCGLILNGKLFSGTHGFAGELGHTTVDPAGPICACGRTGCLEAVAAMPAMLRAYRQQTSLHEQIDAITLIDRVNGGDVIAIDVMRQAARRIGLSIGSQVNVLNVDTVLIGGRLAHASDVFLDAVKSAIAEVTLPGFREGLFIGRASLGIHAGLIGIASLCMIQSFYPEMS